ncbi:hypothetical protein SK128_021112 [Halocaridina rubra]|uniref:Uncharacterized protein n=1 Tax=Halocaridina rubra TaxID=373956 RepID=A0AAN9A2D4_HALRR
MSGMWEVGIGTRRQGTQPLSRSVLSRAFRVVTVPPVRIAAQKSPSGTQVPFTDLILPSPTCFFLIFRYLIVIFRTTTRGMPLPPPSDPQLVLAEKKNHMSDIGDLTP